MKEWMSFHWFQVIHLSVMLCFIQAKSKVAVATCEVPHQKWWRSAVKCNFQLAFAGTLNSWNRHQTSLEMQKWSWSLVTTDATPISLPFLKMILRTWPELFNDFAMSCTLNMCTLRLECWFKAPTCGSLCNLDCSDQSRNSSNKVIGVWKFNFSFV